MAILSFLIYTSSIYESGKRGLFNKSRHRGRRLHPLKTYELDLANYTAMISRMFTWTNLFSYCYCCHFIRVYTINIPYTSYLQAIDNRCNKQRAQPQHSLSLPLLPNPVLCSPLHNCKQLTLASVTCDLLLVWC